MLRKFMNWLRYTGPGRYDNIPHLNRANQVVWPDGTTTLYEPYSTVDAGQGASPELQKILQDALDNMV